jgi:hypothetical protein
MQALLADIKFDVHHSGDVKLARAAIVGDSRMEETLTRLWDAISEVWPIPADEVRYFDEEQKAEALAWVRQ